ncbi:ATP-binding protein [Chryseobacterium taklimakanense]|uniref:tetratricopeptide repeat-containing sensor histidine kinase n=1 Tax=Chryseobacterium taklimakanense TaxID=536441 RepID=UPI001EF534DD|nr:ATP-binding protein [Chryseobacterium taklimakanense]MCG7280886.1 ATP-binding protein [Chryseobacterium taklimakanense]
MKNLFWLLLFLVPCVFPAQERDSLETLVKKEKNALKKADLLLEIANYLSDIDTVEAISYIKKAQKLIPENNKYLKGKVQFTFGQQFFGIEVDRAQYFYKRAIDILKDQQHKEALILTSRAWHNYGTMEDYKDNSDEFLSIILTKSIPLAIKAGRNDLQAQYLNDIGAEMYDRKQYKKSIDYYDQSLKIIEKEPANYINSQRKIEINTNAAQSYLYMNNGPKAKVYLLNAEKVLEKYPDNPMSVPFYLVYAKYFQLYKNYENSLEQLNKGLEAPAITPQDYFGLIYQKAFSLRNLNRPKEALAVLQTIINRKDLMSTKLNARILHNEMSKIYAELNDYKNAYEHQLETKSLSDSLLAEERDSKALMMETKFRTAEKEKQLAVQELEINKKNQYMWTFIISTLVFLGAGVFTYFYFRNKKKLSEQREINLRQKLKEKEQTEQLKVTKAILDGEERERERVAKDLHDGLGGMLAGVKINLSTWSSNHLEENQYESFHKILNQLDSSVSELRRVARNLMPESLLNFGLEIALKDLCEFYMKDGLTIDFQAINIQKNLPLNLQVNIYRIVQELLNNAVKHSGADNILVQCSQNAEEFYITVEDNGKGITESEMSKVKSLGLKNLQNRVDFLKGKMEIQSTENQGTSVNIEINTHVA